MKISTKGRYALRVMVDLAQHNTGEYISLKDIAERQEVSMKYLEMIIALLNNAGFVISARGKHGGYRLCKPPREYTIGSILKLAEGKLAPVTCLESPLNPCKRATQCLTLPFWEKLNTIVNDYIESVTLADLIKQQQNSSGTDYGISFNLL